MNNFVLLRNPLHYILIGTLALLCMGACRMAFFYTNNMELINHPPLSSIIIGLRFDLSIVCYWLAPVVLLHFVYHKAVKKPAKIFIAFEKGYIFLGFLTILLVYISDIFYYHYYYSHLSAAVLSWLSSPREVWAMVWKDPTFRYGLIILLCWAIVFFFVYRFLLRKFQPQNSAGKKGLIFYCLLFPLLFLGMRGGLRAKPLNAKDAICSEHYFFNQVAASPVYNLYEELFEHHEFMYEPENQSETEILKLTEKYEDFDPHFAISSGLKNKPNVVFILMESMASFKLSQAHFLDSISKRSIYFDSFYSTGEHTYNGIFSSLFGEPAIMQKHLLRWLERSEISGLPGILKENGYYNIFHIPHGRTFDNMNAFLWRHHFDTLIDYTNIPRELSGGSAWGTSDHLLFTYAINNMDNLVQKGKPVFNIILTISDHPPYYVPSGKDVPAFYGNLKDVMVQYVDWSLRRFFQEASQKNWFKNTVFVMVGDHGSSNNKEDYPLPLTLHHIPCLIYAPGLGMPAFTVHNFGMQQDILPTLAGLLGFTHEENPLAIDLLKKKRNFAFFCSDNFCGILDHSAYFMLNASGEKYFSTFENNHNTALKEQEMHTELLDLTRYTALRLKNARR